MRTVVRVIVAMILAACAADSNPDPDSARDPDAARGGDGSVGGQPGRDAGRDAGGSGGTAAGAGGGPGGAGGATDCPSLEECVAPGASGAECPPGQYLFEECYESGNNCWYYQSSCEWEDGAEECPPCEAPPHPACVGHGPCGCAPYDCPTPAWNFCPGVEPPPPIWSFCRSDADCIDPPGPTHCVAPGTQRACETPCEVAKTCAQDPDCPADHICLEFLGNCCLAGDEVSSDCVPRCTPETCGAGERCGDLGRCEPIPCQDPGHACDLNFRCQPAGECQRLPCATSADCDCGECVLGQCYEQPGLCRPRGP